MYKKMLFTFYAICLCSIIGSAKDLFNAHIPHDPPVINIAIGNWNNFMDPEGCVHLDQGESLKIKFVVTLGVGDLSPFTPLYYRTNIYDGSQNIPVTQITNSDLTPHTLENGYTVYIFEQDVFTMSFEDECAFDPSKLLDFEYDMTLTDENGNPYPIESNTGLLTPTPPANVPANEGSVTILPTVAYTGTKDLCCNGYTGPEGLIQNTENEITYADTDQLTTTTHNSEIVEKTNTSFDHTSNTSKLQQAVAFPNPFNEHLVLEFNSEMGLNTSIQLWDMSGQLVKQQVYKSTFSGKQKIDLITNQLENGVYYCSIKNVDSAHVFKVIKLTQ